MGRATSEACGKKLYLDTSSYEHDKKRKYELSQYHIKYNQCGKNLKLRVLRCLYENSKNAAFCLFLQEKCGYGKEKEEYLFQDNSKYCCMDGY